MSKAEISAYTLFSSSSGNCAYIKCGRDEILIDAGVSARRIDLALRELGSCYKNIRAIFITHEHGDHISGLQMISKYYKIPVYAPYASAREIAKNYPETGELLRLNDGGNITTFDYIRITAVKTPHDSRASVGFKIEFGDEKMAYFTDIGHLSGEVADALIGCASVVLESNHDIEMLKNGPYPYIIKKRILGGEGHLSNKDCSCFLPVLAENGAKRIVLAHLSKNNNKPEIAFNESRGKLLSSGIKISANGVCGDVELKVAVPSGAVKII